MAGAVYMIGFLLLGGAAAWTIDIIRDITVHMNQVISVPFSVHNNDSLSNPQLWVINANRDIAIPSFKMITSNKTSINGILNITGVFLGRTKLTLTMMEMAVGVK